MLLANLAKSSSMERLIPLERRVVPALSPSTRAIAQLLELYNVGAIGKYNQNANFDYLAYVFADLAKVNGVPSHNADVGFCGNTDTILGTTSTLLFRST